MQAAVNEIVHGSSVTEAHLVFSRMHVDVDPARIQRQEQHKGREPSMVKDVGVSLFDGVSDGFVANRTAVDEEILLIRGGP